MLAKIVPCRPPFPRDNSCRQVGTKVWARTGWGVTMLSPLSRNTRMSGRSISYVLLYLYVKAVVETVHHLAYLLAHIPYYYKSASKDSVPTHYNGHDHHVEASPERLDAHKDSAHSGRATGGTANLVRRILRPQTSHHHVHVLSLNCATSHRLYPHFLPPDNSPQPPTESTPEPGFALGMLPYFLSLASCEPYRNFDPRHSAGRILHQDHGAKS